MVYINNSNSHKEDNNYQNQSNRNDDNFFREYQKTLTNTTLVNSNVRHYLNDSQNNYDQSKLFNTNTPNGSVANFNSNHHFDSNRYRTIESCRPNYSNQVGLNSSDDEALENYLNDLAKNYDDIDRRIRNAEKFVSQIEEAQNHKQVHNMYSSVASTTTSNVTHKFPLHQHPMKFPVKNHCTSYNRSDDIMADNSNKIKYVTELRVNIADNELCDNNANKSNLHPNNQYGLISPNVRSSVTPKISLDQTNSFRSTNFCSNMANVFQESNSIHSRSSSSHSMKIELDQINIPPPTLFNTNTQTEFPYHPNSSVCQVKVKSECLVKNQEVQTSDEYIYDLIHQKSPRVEERSAQTVSPMTLTIKATVDTGVGTDTKLVKHKGSMHSHTNEDSEVDLEESDQSITDKAGYNKLAHQESFTSNNESIETTNGHDQWKSEDTTSVNIKKSVTQTSKSITNSSTLKKKHLHSKTIGLTTKIVGAETNVNVDKRSKTMQRANKSNIPIVDMKDSTKNASIEIQRLLENLGSHLKATMSMRETKTAAAPKTAISTESSSASFWDNPLHKHDLIAASLKSTNKRSVVPTKKLSTNKGKPIKTAGLNVINSELQAICKTFENKKKMEHANSRNNENLVDDRNFSTNSSDSDEKSMNQIDHLTNNQHLLCRSNANNKKMSTTSNQVASVNSNGGQNNGGQVSTVGQNNILNSNQNPAVNNTANNISSSQTTVVGNPNQNSSMKFLSSGDRPSGMDSYKATRTFELSPYDDLIKSHLSPCDRRVKAVAAKNGCKICIDGPINVYDPTSCQAFRNKVTYRCIIAGQNKDNLDKCMNYLKETFPNTFLRINQRSNQL